MSLYYTAPSEEYFKEMKMLATEIWNSYDDTHGYAYEKISRIKDIQNIEDNFMYILAMFDPPNQAKLLSRASVWLRVEIKIRLDSVS